MSFNISFDYRFDTGFFDDPAARAALEAAADIWEGLIQDEFDDVPAGTTVRITNPADRNSQVDVVLDTDIDDLLIFVAGNTLNGPLAIGGFTSFGPQGDVYNVRTSADFRGTGPATDFEPWVGTIVFDINAGWNFDLAAPAPGLNDFLAVAMHEMAHVMGVGTAPAFRALANGTSFEGVNAMVLTNNQGIPLEADLGHVLEGYEDDMVLLDPFLTTGSRVAPSIVDLAILSDIGYEIAGYVTQGSTPPIVTEGNDRTVFGTIFADYIDGQAGNDQLQGDDGNDTLLTGTGDDIVFGQGGDDLIIGGAGTNELQGGAGNDTFRVGTGADAVFGQGGNNRIDIYAGGGSGDGNAFDFDLATDTLRIVAPDFASTAEALASITKPFSNVSRIELSDGTRFDVFHDSQSGTPLTAAHISVVQATPFQGSHLDDVLTGTAGHDSLDGFGGADTLTGGDGNDTLLGWDGDDVLTGGTSSADLRDLIFGGAGRDSIDGGYGNDELRGDADNDTIVGGFGVDTIIGGAGDDDLTGQAWSDLIFGGDGNDFINGGFGFDRVNGGNGADRFFHIGIADHGSDWIQDFDSAEGDVLVWGGIAADAGDFLVQRATTPNAGDASVAEIFVTHVPSQLLVWALVDGDLQTNLVVRSGGTEFDLLA